MRDVFLLKFYGWALLHEDVALEHDAGHAVQMRNGQLNRFVFIINLFRFIFITKQIIHMTFLNGRK